MCVNPILAVSLFKNSEDRNVLKFIPSGQIDKIEDIKRVYGSDEVYLLPCTKCKECRDDYAKQWALRCSLEAECHKFNYFITLTFDDFHLPFNVKKARNDFIDFTRDFAYFLSKSKNRIKFFACVEKGELTNRIHLHGILFLDKELHLIDPIKKGDFYHFHSPDISEVWTQGLHDITPFDHDCAAYVGKYATKQGNCFMSRNLGKDYYLKHRDEIINDNFKIYVDFNQKNFVDIPKVMVRWFLEDKNLSFDEFLKFDEFRLDQKQLQRLLCIAEIKRKGFSSETKLVGSKILAFLKHDKYAKERSEF